MKATSKVSGEFKLLVTNASTGKTRVAADWFPNLVTNAGLDRLVNGDYTNFVQVGTGTAIPQFADTTLANWRAGTNRARTTSVSFGGVPHYQSILTVQWQFDMGAASGNLSEVGVSHLSSGSLFSRALILDSNGNPTTITVLANEFLTVIYKFSKYPPLNDIESTIVLGGITHEVTGRAMGVNGGLWGSFGFGTVSTETTHKLFTSGLTSLTGSYGTVAGGSGTGATYVPGSYTRSVTSYWGLTSQNMSARLLGATFNYSDVSPWPAVASFQYEFNPPIEKNNTNTLSLTTSYSWARRT